MDSGQRVRVDREAGSIGRSSTAWRGDLFRRHSRPRRADRGRLIRADGSIISRQIRICGPATAGEFDAVNHQGTVNVLDAALAAGAVRVLHTSTESILTKARYAGPIDENIKIELSDAVGPYCRSKLLAEQYAFLLAGQGRPVVVANPTMPVGPGDRNLSPPTRLGA